jgi:hypothetical protein
MLATAFFFPSAIRYLSGGVAGFCLLAGTVLYVMGRIAQITRPRAQA